MRRTNLVLLILSLVFSIALPRAHAEGPPSDCAARFRLSVAPKAATDSSLESWIVKHRASGDKLLEENTLPNGAMKAGGGLNNHEYPDVWTRDEAIARYRQVKTLRRLYEKYPTAGPAEVDSQKEKLLKLVLPYLDFTEKVHRTPTPVVRYGTAEMVRDEHGAVVTALNPAEPKYTVEGDALLIGWGRPQNDGPALRARALTSLGLFLEKKANDPIVKRLVPNMKTLQTRIYDGLAPLDTRSAVKIDMEYVFHHTAIDKNPDDGKWLGYGFEYWEETLARAHFSTMLVQRQALVESAVLARADGDLGAAREYFKKAKLLEPEILGMWDSDKKYLISHRDRPPGSTEIKPSNADTQVVIAIMQTQGPGALFRVTDEKVISTVHQFEELFNGTFEVNRNPAFRKKYPRSQAMGRYPEDKYAGRSPTDPAAKDDQGNPWILIQNTWAHLHYTMAREFAEKGSIPLTELTLPFFKKLFLAPDDPAVAELKVGTELSRKSPLFKAVLRGLLEKAEESLAIVREVSENGGYHNEQFNRAIYPLKPDARSSEGLSWNAVTFEDAIEARTEALQALEKAGL